jgi:hypothetical protein
MNAKCRKVLGILLMLLLITSSVMMFSHKTYAEAEEYLSPDSLLAEREQWQIYEDSDYGFALEYPVGWEAKIVTEQRRPYNSPEKIVKEYAFIGPNGYIVLAVLLTRPTTIRFNRMVGRG